jgi:hypothetical protein
MGYYLSVVNSLFVMLYRYQSWSICSQPSALPLINSCVRSWVPLSLINLLLVPMSWSYNPLSLIAQLLSTTVSPSLINSSWNPFIKHFVFRGWVTFSIEYLASWLWHMAPMANPIIAKPRARTNKHTSCDNAYMGPHAIVIWGVVAWHIYTWLRCVSETHTQANLEHVFAHHFVFRNNILRTLCQTCVRLRPSAQLQCNALQSVRQQHTHTQRYSRKPAKLVNRCLWCMSRKTINTKGDVARLASDYVCMGAAVLSAVCV